MVQLHETSEVLSLVHDVCLMSYPGKSFLLVVFMRFVLGFPLIGDFDDGGAAIWPHYLRQELQLEVKSSPRQCHWPIIAARIHLHEFRSKQCQGTHEKANQRKHRFWIQRSYAVRLE